MIKYLKIIVVVLGVLIIAGVVIIAVKLADTGTEMATGGPSGDGSMPAYMPAPSVAELGLPPGSQVKSMEASNNRLILNIRLPDTSERIVILNISSGAVVADLELVGAP